MFLYQLCERKTVFKASRWNIIVFTQFFVARMLMLKKSGTFLVFLIGFNFPMICLAEGIGNVSGAINAAHSTNAGNTAKAVTSANKAANAATPEATTTASSSSLVFAGALSAGPSWGSAGRNQTLDLGAGVRNTYTANHQSNTLANYELFLGMQTPLGEKVLGQFGVDFAATSDARLSGDIWANGNPTANNYSYEYQLRHNHVAAKAKFIGDFCWVIQPWISATLGMAFNQSHGYSSRPTVAGFPSLPIFASKTISAFTYAVGVGIQYPFAKNFQVGVGYEFTDWGHSRLGPMDGAATNQTLSLPHFYTNSVMFNLAYVQ